jgi:CheY-like chemotaxis protein
VAEGHEVSFVADVQAAIASFVNDSPEIMVVDWGTKLGSAAEFVKTVRAREADTHVYTIALMQSLTPSSIAAAFGAGVDDVMQKPLIREELVARVGALARIKRWAERVLAPRHDPQDAMATMDLSRTRAWVDADRSISFDLMEMLGRKVIPAAPGGAGAIVFTSAAEIPLSLAAEGLEVRLMVAFDAESLALVGEIVFAGSAVPAEAFGDIVREFANTAAGAFKRAALAEGVTLTTGIPVNVEPIDFGRQSSGLLKEFIASVEGSPMRVGVRIAVRTRALERVTPDKLREGMVVGRDIVNADGVLLIPSGTRLTEATVMRLATILRPRALVEIAAAA